MTKLIRFRDITTKDLDKIINKHYTHWHQFNPAMNLEETIDKFKNSFTREKVYQLVMLFMMEIT